MTAVSQRPLATRCGESWAVSVERQRGHGQQGEAGGGRDDRLAARRDRRSRMSAGHFPQRREAIRTTGYAGNGRTFARVLPVSAFNTPASLRTCPSLSNRVVVLTVTPPDFPGLLPLRESPPLGVVGPVRGPS